MKVTAEYDTSASSAPLREPKKPRPQASFRSVMPPA